MGSYLKTDGGHNLAPIGSGLLKFTLAASESFAATPNSKFPVILVKKRTKRHDAVNKLQIYDGGWNISNKIIGRFMHYMVEKLIRHGKILAINCKFGNLKVLLPLVGSSSMKNSGGMGDAFACDNVISDLGDYGASQFNAYDIDANSRNLMDWSSHMGPSGSNNVSEEGDQILHDPHILTCRCQTCRDNEEELWRTCQTCRDKEEELWRFFSE